MPLTTTERIEKFAQAKAAALALLARDFFDEGKHPRYPAGSPLGGQFAPAGGADAAEAEKPEAEPSSKVAETVAITNARAKASIEAGAAASKSTPLNGSKGHPATISTSKITAKRDATDNSEVDYVRADVAQMRKDAEMFEHNVGLFRDTNAYPMRPDEVAGDTESVLTNIKARMKANLIWLYNTTSADVREMSSTWYPGGRLLVDEYVTKYGASHGLTDSAAAGVIAALSPQKDWNENVYLADRVLDIYLTKQNAGYDDAMAERSAEMIRAAQVKLRNTPPEKRKKGGGEWIKALKAIKGKSLAELQSTELKAAWIRLYDEAHSVDADGEPARHYRIIAPDGSRGEYATNADGSRSQAAWQALSAISPAIEAIEANGDREKISAALSNKHKVRSFYNNLLDPFSENGDITIDTHAVGAAFLMPWSNRNYAVGHSLASQPLGATKAKGWVGAKGSIANGIFGTYPIYADAAREAAAELGISPRALQSITWVAKKERFSENMTDQQKADVAQVWKDFQAGSITLDQAHARIDTISPMRKPAWMP